MNALMRGRTLNPEAVKRAKIWRDNRIKELQDMIRINPLDFKARRQLRKMDGKP